MSRRTSLTVPLVEHSSRRSRSRSVDDRSNAPVRTPAPRPSFIPGAYPLSSDEDEDSHNITPNSRIPRVTKNRDDASQPRPSSARKSHVKPPTTPERRRPEPKEIASDPGHVPRARQDALDDRPRPYRQGHSLPCGHLPFKKPMGKRSRDHQISCRICIKHQREEDEQEVFGGREEEFGDGKEATTPIKCSESHCQDGDDSEDISTIIEDFDQEKIREQPGEYQVQVSAQVLHLNLIKEAKKPLTPGEEQGHIYIFRDPRRKGLLKIGRSKGIKEREQQHKTKCGLLVEWVLASNRVKNVKRAERLTQIDLNHLCRPWKCPKCSQKHGEWFEVEEEKAKEVVRRWTRWINEQDPYLNHELKPVWAYMMDWRRIPDPELENHDHKGRWTHWNTVLSPISSDDKKSFNEHWIRSLHQNNEEDIQKNRHAISKNEKLLTTPLSSKPRGALRNVTSNPNTNVQFQHAHFYGSTYINQTP